MKSWQNQTLPKSAAGLAASNFAKSAIGASDIGPGKYVGTDGVYEGQLECNLIGPCVKKKWKKKIVIWDFSPN